MSPVSLTYPYPLHTFPLIGAPLPPALTMTIATSTTCTIPVFGHALRRLQQPGAAGAGEHSGRERRECEFDDQFGDCRFRSLGGHSPTAGRGNQGDAATVPSSRPSGKNTTELIDQQDAARAAEIRELRRKFSVSLAAGILAMLLSLPLASADPGTTHDPLMRVMMPLSRMLERIVPDVADVSGRRVAVSAARADHPGDRLGRAAFLQPGVDRRAAPHAPT